MSVWMIHELLTVQSLVYAVYRLVVYVASRVEVTGTQTQLVTQETLGA